MGCCDVRLHERWCSICSNVSFSSFYFKIFSFLFALHDFDFAFLHFDCRYEAQLEKDWRFIVEDSEAKLILAANERIRTIVEEYVGKV